jgi:hypothetical protein
MNILADNILATVSEGGNREQHGEEQREREKET